MGSTAQLRVVALVGAVAASPGSAFAQPAEAKAEAAPAFVTAPIALKVAVVEDPDLPALDDALVQDAFRNAASEYARRFDVAPPTFELDKRFDVTTFLGTYADPKSEQCADEFAARYKGTGIEELAPFKKRALEFFRRWPLDSLRGFVPEAERSKMKRYEDIYDAYAAKYVARIDAMKALRTASGTPLIDPEASMNRSFVAWLCALERQTDFDVVITNAFIVTDLLTEPHPHSVFGKAKIGGIAARSGGRDALEGQALLATTFGIDTQIEELNEIGGAPLTPPLRARLLGAYLLAHEIAHAVFGIPDVYDHPPGCLMTSRPGATYLDGLDELDANPRPCPRCRPYVEARSFLDQGRLALGEGDARAANDLFLASVKGTPRHFHGGRRKRLARVTVASSKAQQLLGRAKRALRYAKLAAKLDPGSTEARGHLEALTLPVVPLAGPGANTVVVSRTASTATSTVSAP